jgi:hypothetical protein
MELDEGGGARNLPPTPWGSGFRTTTGGSRGGVGGCFGDFGEPGLGLEQGTQTGARSDVPIGARNIGVPYDSEFFSHSFLQESFNFPIQFSKFQKDNFLFWCGVWLTFPSSFEDTDKPTADEA